MKKVKKKKKKDLAGLEISPGKIGKSTPHNYCPEIKSYTNLIIS
jgi:hypothetical protein